MYREKLFYGHGISSMITNTISAVFAVVLAYTIVVLVHGLSIAGYLSALTWLLVELVFFAEPTYLMCEFKHVLFEDGIADTRPFAAVVVFGAQSCLGFVASICTIVCLRYCLPLSAWWNWCIIPLAFLSSIGAAIGLADGHGFQLFFNLKDVWQVSLSTLLQRKSWIFILAITVFLSVGCLAALLLLDGFWLGAIRIGVDFINKSGR